VDASVQAFDHLALLASDGTMRDAVVHGRRPGSVPTYVQELLELLRISVVAGVTVGILVIGLGSRLAMFVLRVTSPDYVVGMESDDGFEIGRITLSGSYQLLTLGAAVGVIGALGYVAVAPWLIGPDWFRRVTVGLTAGALVGSLVIVPGGIDFTLLEPTWLAVALFVGLPIVSGILLTLAVDLVATPDSWTGHGRTAWLLPVVLLALVPPAARVLAPVVVIVAVLLPLRRLLLPTLLGSRVERLAVRGAFLVIPVLSFMALGQDLAELY
jgi:hypothetical protein